MTKKARRSLMEDAEQVELASAYVEMGARLSVLEAITTISKEKLSSLYREIQGKSPPKGQLPYSTEWYLSWQPNIHSSLFLGYHSGLRNQELNCDHWVTAKAFRLYQDQIRILGLPEVLTMTRAWRLVQFMNVGMLSTASCKLCGGKFVVDPYGLNKQFTCGLCKPPSKAGRGASDSPSYVA